jgi:hypothetical protein
MLKYLYDIHASFVLVWNIDEEIVFARKKYKTCHYSKTWKI